MEKLAEARVFVEDAKRKAVKTLLEYGNHRSILLGFTSDGQGDLLVDAAEIHPSQRWPILRGMLARAGAVGYVLIDEAWTVRARPGEIETVRGEEPGQGFSRRKPGVPMPRDHPDRREVVMVQWQFKLPGADEWAGMWEQFFRHDGGEDGPIVLEEAMDIEEEGGRMRGRGTRLLDPAPVEPEVLPPGFGG